MQLKRVLKRNGEYENISFDKITQRLKNLCDISPKCNEVDYIFISQKVISYIYEGIPTWELDDKAYEICLELSKENNQYDILAKRIMTSNIKKKIRKDPY